MTKSRMVVVVLGILAITASAATVIYKLYALPTYEQEASAELMATENALATAELVAISSIDLDHIRKLEEKIGGKSVLPDLKNGNNTGGSVLSILGRAVMAHPEDVAYASAAVYIRKEGGVSSIIVAGGRFQYDEVVKVMKASGQAQPHPQLKNTWLLQAQNIDTCQMSKQWTVSVTENRVIASDGNTVLMERLEQPAPAVRDITKWREFRQSRFIAAAVFMPKELPQQGIDPMLGQAAQLSRQGLVGFNEIYIGAASRSFPPGGSLTLWLSAESSQIAAKKATDWNAQLTVSREDWGNTLPSFAALHDQAVIGVQGNLLQADIALDEKLADKLRSLPGELVGLMFSGFGMKTQIKQAQSAEPAEVIDKMPRVFEAQTGIDAIATYEAKGPFDEAADVMAGPFGIQLVAVRLPASTPQALELEIKTAGMKLPNVGDQAGSAMALTIKSVRDKEGKELLREETCGRDRNSLPARPAFGGDSISTVKKVRLQDGVRHADVAVIQGNVQVRLPVRIETVALAAPKLGDHIEREGLRIEITKLETGSLSYRISGEVERLLHLRAKNAKGEPLAWGGRFSMGSLFGEAQTVTSEFKGKVTSLEFVLAQMIEQKDFAFELADARLRKEHKWTLDKPATFEAVGKDEIKRDYAKKATEPKRYRPPVASVAVDGGIAIIDLGGVNAFSGLQLFLSMHLPPLKSFDGALSAAEFDVREITLADTSVHHPVAGAAAWRMPITLNRESDGMIHGHSGWLETGVKVKSEELRSVSGLVSLKVPLALEKKTIIVADVGAETATPCGTMSINEIARSGLSLAGSGEAGCLFAVRMLNAEGKDMRINSADIKHNPQGWQRKFSTNGAPSALELVMVKKSKRIDFPFKLTVAGNGETVPH